MVAARALVIPPGACTRLIVLKRTREARALGELHAAHNHLSGHARNPDGLGSRLLGGESWCIESIALFEYPDYFTEEKVEAKRRLVDCELLEKYYDHHHPKVSHEKER
jgi:hypothetical protein